MTVKMPCFKCGSPFDMDKFPAHFADCPGSLGKLTCTEGWEQTLTELPERAMTEFTVLLHLPDTRLLVVSGRNKFFSSIRVIRLYNEGRSVSTDSYALVGDPVTASLPLPDHLQNEVNSFLATLPAPVLEIPPLSEPATAFLNALAPGTELRAMDILKQQKDRLKFADLPGVIAELYNQGLIEVLNMAAQPRYKITKKGKAHPDLAAGS